MNNNFFRVAQNGGEFGQKLAEPHAKKPEFVLAVAAIVIVCGGLLAWFFRGSSKGAFWFGVFLMLFGVVGIIRGILLRKGKDFE